MSDITIKQIAELAGVSPSTVSNALNGQKNVGAATRERVLKICKEQGYTPNLSGRSLKAGSSNTVVFNFSDFDRSFYLKIIQGISDYLTQNDYNLIICTNVSSRNFMKSSFTRGAISLDSKMTNEDLSFVAGEYFPIIVMDRIIEHPYIQGVLVDNYPAMCRLVQQMADKGLRRFGFIGGLAGSLDNQERYRAFLDTLGKNNISFDYKNYYHGDFREKSGYQAANIMLLSDSLPEIIVCANDNMAVGAIRAFREKGLRIPEDIFITGFDDEEIANTIGLTSVSIPRYESGFLAAKCLLEMIERGTPHSPLKIRASIIRRSSF